MPTNRLLEYYNNSPQRGKTGMNKTEGNENLVKKENKVHSG